MLPSIVAEQITSGVGTTGTQTLGSRIILITRDKWATTLTLYYYNIITNHLAEVQKHIEYVGPGGVQIPAAQEVNLGKTIYSKIKH